MIGLPLIHPFLSILPHRNLNKATASPVGYGRGNYTEQHGKIEIHRNFWKLVEIYYSLLQVSITPI
ncbi:MAG: hypothetical protein AB1393_05590 [Candidatus Edwardsbacteria bacterium]